MKVKVGDTVKVIAGKDKGKEGKVIRTIKTANRVVVEGLNIVKRHSKPRTNEDKGGIIEVEAPIHVSNVKVLADVKKATKEKKVEAKEAEVKETKKTTTKKTAAKKETK